MYGWVCSLILLDPRAVNIHKNKFKGNDHCRFYDLWKGGLVRFCFCLTYAFIFSELFSKV